MSIAYLDPAGNGAHKTWDAFGGPPPIPAKWDCVNDAVRYPGTSMDGYFLATTTQSARMELTLTASPADTGTVTQLTVRAYGYAAGAGADILVDLDISGSLGAKGLGLGGTGVWWGSATWTGSWTKANVDSMGLAHISGSAGYYFQIQEIYVEITCSAGAVAAFIPLVMII